MRRAATPCRRFTLLDAMILVGVAGLMLWISRGRFDREKIPASLRTSEDVRIAAIWLTFLFPNENVWTLGVLALSLRRPRPSLRRLSRQPGFLACLTASAVALVGLLAGLILECLTNAMAGFSIAEINWESIEFHTLNTLPAKASFAVAAAWIVQMIVGRWRPQPTWTDRLGRATGVFWLAVIPIHEFARLVGAGCL